MCYVGDNTKKDFIAPDKLGMKSILFEIRMACIIKLIREW